MSGTAYSGPIIQYGVTLSSTSGDGITGQDLEHNDQRAPAYADLGDAMLDPRSAYNYRPGAAVTSLSMGFFNNVGFVDYVPPTLSSNAFVSNSVVSTGVTTFTLNAASSANGTVSTTIIAPETGKATGTLICIGSTAAYLAFGADGTFCVWNPGAGTGRAVSIAASSSADGGVYTVVGRDMYGYKMTEQISPGTGGNATGQKAFKYISSITNTSTPTSTGVSIGIADKYGFPFAVPYTGLNAQVEILATSFSSAVIVPLSSANTTLASTAATQTSTTPDVRGTYASTTASNGTVRLQMLVTPAASAVAAITSTNVAPLFGGTQFSSV